MDGTWGRRGFAANPAGSETSPSSKPRLGRRNCCSWRQATATISCTVRGSAERQEVEGEGSQRSTGQSSGTPVIRDSPRFAGIINSIKGRRRNGLSRWGVLRSSAAGPCPTSAPSFHVRDHRRSEWSTTTKSIPLTPQASQRHIKTRGRETNSSSRCINSSLNVSRVCAVLVPLVLASQIGWCFGEEGHPRTQPCQRRPSMISAMSHKAYLCGRSSRVCYHHSRAVWLCCRVSVLPPF